jgi:hypothetical protein
MFTGCNVYLGAAIKGVKAVPDDFLWEVAQWMIQWNANVLSEHVAARTPDEMTRIFLARSGVDREAAAYPPQVAREVDFMWVDECTHLIAFVDGSSTGVGMEAQRALDRFRGIFWEIVAWIAGKLGFRVWEQTFRRPKVLCLVHESNLATLTWMLRGITPEMYPQFQLLTYTDLASVKKIIARFLGK